MNADSRGKGNEGKPSKPQGKRRIVEGAAVGVAKLPTPRDELLAANVEASEPKLTREHLRRLALDELTAGAIAAAKTIRKGIRKKGRRERGQGNREASARWLLKTVFELVSDTEEPAENKPATSTPADVTDLAEARQALQHKLRQLRNGSAS